MFVKYSFNWQTQLHIHTKKSYMFVKYVRSSLRRYIYKNIHSTDNHYIFRDSFVYSFKGKMSLRRYKNIKGNLYQVKNLVPKFYIYLEIMFNGCNNT
ncbi:UNVERIFIED_CONTAM: hypothetical protein NCL1_56186 [Trichonephila clavipes]